MGYIYKITNKIDNKIYIGQTIRDIYLRWKEHKKKRTNCKYLKAAFEKHGLENFDFKLICISFDNNLNELETYYIKKYNSLVPNGYNLRNGGNNGKLNEETKQKISESLKKNKTRHSEQTMQLIKSKLTGQKRTLEQTLNNSKAKLNGKTIDQFDLNNNFIKNFESFNEIANTLNLSKPAIMECCRGKSKTSFGYIWKYNYKYA